MSKTQIHVLSFISFFATLAIAFGLDRWLEYTREQVSRLAIHAELFLWSLSLAYLILAVCAFSLYTWAMPRLDRWALWLMLIIGLFIDLAPVLSFTPIPVLNSIMAGLISSRSFLVLSGGLTAVAAAFTLFRTKSNHL